MPDLPDVNVWIALSDPGHTAHAAAVQYWRDEAASEILFCRTTALGLARNLSRKTAPDSVPLSPAESWRAYKRWLSAPGVSIMADPPRVEERLEAFYESGLVTHRLSTDAYLAAFAITGGSRLVTFDQGFRLFPGLELLLLSP